MSGEAQPGGGSSATPCSYASPIGGIQGSQRGAPSQQSGGPFTGNRPMNYKQFPGSAGQPEYPPGLGPMVSHSPGPLLHQATQHHATPRPVGYASVSRPQFRPVYTAVGSPGARNLSPRPQSSMKQPSIDPKDWPAAVKNYVERCFKLCKPSQRPTLQHILKIVINDAQKKGELWTKKWDSLPAPDLNMKPADAASVIIQAGAVIKPMVAPDAAFRPLYQTPRTSTTPMSSASRFSTPQSLGAYVPNAHHAPSRVAPTGVTPTGVTPPNQVVKPMTKEPSMVRFGMTRSMNKKKRTYSACRDSDSDSDVTQGGPWADDEEIRRLKRAGRFKSEGKKHKPSSKGKKHSASNRTKLTAMLESVGGDGEQINWDDFAVKGTCQDLEKSYFRLTSAPDPSTVRPQPVLRKALDRLNRLILSREVNYFYAQDQYKGMRQDCVIQAIKGGLAAEIYESHARAALEYGDVAEYNQCQGQLRVLYADGVASPHGAEPEFLAYRILYQAVHAHKGELVALLHTLQQIRTSKFAKHPAIVHALKVRSAIASHNYALFFKLYYAAPALGRALMDLAVRSLRFKALTEFVKAFKPYLCVDFIVNVLGFKREGTVQAQAPQSSRQVLPGCSSNWFEGKHSGKESMKCAMSDCEEWLLQCGAVVVDAGTSKAAVDCKASFGKLTIPEEKNAVAHGDANLDIGDFLKGFTDE